MGDDLLGGGVQDDAALVDDDDAVGFLACLGQVVGSEEERAPGGGFFAHRVPELAAGEGVHAGGGLVEDDEVRVAGQSEGEAHPLHFAAGELGEAARGQRGEAGPLQELVGRNGACVHRGDQVDGGSNASSAR